MIFDVHAHYDDEAFNEDRQDVFDKLRENGVIHVINAGTDLKSSLLSVEFSKQNSFISAAVGYHPECIDRVEENYLYELENLSKEKGVVAIGEIGLDYHYDLDREKQKVIFSKQLELSRDLNLPVIIHDREAHLDTLTIIKKYKPRGILHCYSGSAEFLQEVLKENMSISIGGVVTFKNARQILEVAKAVPEDRFMLETDAPYMSPVPFRGKRCDSSLIKYTAEKIAELRGTTVEKILNITKENACNTFNIKL